jgi:hypothetical protein
MSTISVVIPTRNDAHMLSVCLAALARQSRRADEVIVVDNGSTDNTAAILEAAGPLTAVTGPGEFYGGTRFARWLGRDLYIAGYFWVVGWLLGHPPLFGSNFAMRSAVWERLRGSVSRGLPPVHDDLDIFLPGPSGGDGDLRADPAGRRLRASLRKLARRRPPAGDGVDHVPDRIRQGTPVPAPPPS